MKVFKIFIIRFLAFALVVLSVSAWSLEVQRREYQENKLTTQTEMMTSDISHINDWLGSQVSDIIFLRDAVGLILKNSSISSSNEDKALITKVFSNYARTENSYSRISWFTPEGNEIIRINVEDSKPTSVPQEKLQNAGGSEFFHSALDSGGIYLSGIKKVKIPANGFEKNGFFLVSATALRDDNGKVLGVIAATFNCNTVFDILSPQKHRSTHSVWLITDHLTWHNSISTGNVWKTEDSDADSSFINSYPYEWGVIGENFSGSMYTSGGLFVYGRYLAGDISEVGVHSVKNESPWIIVTRISPEEMLPHWLLVFGGIILFILLWSGLITWKRVIELVRQQNIAASLMESEQRFKDVTNAAGGFTWETGPNGIFTFVTGKPEDVLGYHTDDLIGKSPFDFAVSDDAWNIRRDFLDAANAGQEFNNLEYRCAKSNGEIVWLSFNGIPLFDRDKAVIGFRGTAVDITPRKKSENEVRESEELLSSVTNAIQDGLVLMDENGFVHLFNPAAVKLFGFSEDEFLGLHLQDYVRLNDNNESEMDMLSSESPVPEDYLGSFAGILDAICSRKSGHEFNAEIAVSPVRRNDSWWVVWSIRDITDRKEVEEKLLRLATTDSLTGLFNRRVFMETAGNELERSIRYGRPLSMLMLDIDHFKRVNDTYGHDAGDDVLKFLSGIGLKLLRGMDCFARIGGEEFAVLLPDTPLGGAISVAERMREEVEKTEMTTRSGNLYITISIGVSNLNEEISDLESMLKAADVALYAAKRDGRNRVCVQSGTDGKVE